MLLVDSVFIIPCGFEDKVIAGNEEEENSNHIEYALSHLKNRKWINMNFFVLVHHLTEAIAMTVTLMRSEDWEGLCTDRSICMI